MNKAELLRAWDSVYQAALATLESADPEQIIYEESGWRVKDIVAHVATWDAEGLRSLHAFRRGGEYRIPNYVGADDFNGFAASIRMDEPMAQILADWDATRKWFRLIVSAMSEEDLSAEMTHPSGMRETARQLALDLLEHEEEHLGHIRQALSLH